jgi:polysaccharide export outer membrane protein
MKTMVILPAALFLTLSATMHAQERHVAPGVLDAADAPSAAGAYRIGMQDELRITVFDEPASMLAAGFIRNPQVRVEVNQYKSQFVYVIGEVRAPGKITMTGAKMTLLEALALAGSPTTGASSEVIVVRPVRPSAGGARAQPVDSNPEGTRITVNRRDLELGKAGHDAVLQDGDIINVPAARHFYITGMVRSPGTFVLDHGLTIQQAIALAGGLNERGSDRRIEVRRLVDGKLTDLSIERVDQVLAGDTITIASRFF